MPRTKKQKLEIIEGDIITLKKTVMVSDPCYEPPTWCQIKLNNVKPGKYHTYVIKSDENDWGIRCSRLVVIHEDHIKDKLVWLNIPGEVGADSGQAGIFSNETYRKDGMKIKTPEKTYDGRTFDLPIVQEGDDWYLKMCKITLTDEGWGTYKNGLVSRSGLGDGGYALFGTYSEELSSGKIKVTKGNGLFVGLCVDFGLINTTINESLNRK